MKKINVFIFAGLMMALLLAGCKKDAEAISTDSVDKPVDVLLITDYGTVNDGSFNEGAWKGISKYAEENNVQYDNYCPVDTTKESYLSEIKRGVKNGAKVIVCPGYMFEEAIYEAQNKYQDVKFILLDGAPHNEDFSDYTIGQNVMSIAFAEEQAGFLAGYAAVRDGYTRLGFMGGAAEDAVIRYGYGFVQGADYAAIEMGESVHIRYTYTNTFYDEPKVETTANTWYQDDTEVIFACGGESGRAVMRAAEKNEKKVIGVDVDQSSESSTVITSAEKALSKAVYEGLCSYGNGTFNGGRTIVFTAKEGGICLPMENSRFVKFDDTTYDSIYSRLVDGGIEPYNQTDIGTTQELTLINTDVSYIVL